MAMSTDQATEPMAVQVDVPALIQALRTDHEFFINFYIPEEIKVPVPEFHKYIFGLMVSTADPKFACAIPRDHAKSTIAKLVCVHFLLFTEFRFIIYVSNTTAIAKEAVVDVINYIKSENHRAVFGDAEFITERGGEGLYKFDMRVPRADGTMYTKTCIIRALGAGQQVRGINVDNQRPELAIVDDLESLENTATPHLIKQLKKWFYGTFRKALDKFNNKIIQIGNLVSTDGVLKDNLDSEYWASVRLGAIMSNGEPLWPDAWPISKLQEDFTEYLKAGMLSVWFAEMMNIPLPDGHGLIETDKIQWRVPLMPGEPEYTFVTVDPAISNQTWADHVAIVVHGWMPEYQQWVVCDYIHEKGIDPLQMISRSIELALKWRARVIGVESVAYQASLQYFFNYFLVKYQHLGMEVVPLFASQSKTARISGWCGWLMDGSYALPRGDIKIVNQLIQYDPSKKKNDDDLIDSCAYGPQMIERYLPKIRQALTGRHLPEIQSGYQISAV